MKRIKTLAEAKAAQERIARLDALMEKAQANPENWKRTLGCPGARYLPEWEQLMNALSKWMETASDAEIHIVWPTKEV